MLISDHTSFKQGPGRWAKLSNLMVCLSGEICSLWSFELLEPHGGLVNVVPLSEGRKAWGMNVHFVVLKELVLLDLCPGQKICSLVHILRYYSLLLSSPLQWKQVVSMICFLLAMFSWGSANKTVPASALATICGPVLSYQVLHLQTLPHLFVCLAVVSAVKMLICWAAAHGSPVQM